MNGLNLNLVDMVIFSIISFTFTFGIIRGMVDAVFSVASYFFAFWGAGNFVHIAIPFVKYIIKDQYASRLISYIVLFLLVFFIMKWLNILAVKFLKFIGLSAFDRALGGVIGIIKGVLISSIIVIVINIFIPSFANTLNESESVKILQPVIGTMRNVMPKYIGKIGIKTHKKQS